MGSRVPKGFFTAGELLLLPNIITVARLVLAILFPLLARTTPQALSLLLGAAGSDILDGWLARRHGRVTATGVVLDPIADKAFAVAVVVTLVAQNKLPVWGVPCLLVREALEAPLLAYVMVGRPSWISTDLREVGASHPGKLATVCEFMTVLVALSVPSLLTPALFITAVAGVAAGVGYWERELSKR